MQAANPWRGGALWGSLLGSSSQANLPTCAVPGASVSTTSVDPTAARGGLEEQHPFGWRRRHRHLVRHVHLLSALGSTAAPAPCASLAALTNASAQPLSTRAPSATGACGDCLGVETKDGQDVRDSKRADETKSERQSGAAKAKRTRLSAACPRHCLLHHRPQPLCSPRSSLSALSLFSSTLL